MVRRAGRGLDGFDDGFRIWVQDLRRSRTDWVLSGGSMKSKLLAGVFVFLVCLLFLKPAVYGQAVVTSGSISGTVTDPQGGVLPKASIVARETAQGSQYSAASDDSGQYRITGLLPGTYRVTAHIDRFETEAMTG